MYEDGDFIISSIIAGPEKRRSAKLMGYIGWARWSDVFIHIRDTAHAVDTEEVTDARFNARITLNRLQAYMKWMPEDQKALALRAAETIERLLKLVPPGN